MKNPYENLPEIAFWKTAVAQKSLFDIGPVWQPKFSIQPAEKVVTFGSCFAQHIGRALAKRGYAWTSFEQPPKGLSDANAKRFNYNVFSARTGNIYTTSLLHQWTRWATGDETPPAISWEKNGRFYDPFRPAIEPDGFASEDEMLRSRQVTIKALADAIAGATYFVFTLGLTESWKNKQDGYEYAICPGTVAGVFDESQHVFDNQFYEAILAELSAAMDRMLKINPGLKFILTVSPVPLTATNSGNHVMVATMESKSTLRAVAGRLARERAEVDYFPSYEIINSPTSKGTFFEPNQRSVNPYGVNFVMDNFFDCMRRQYGEPVRTEPPADAPAPVAEKPKSQDDVVCEEELLSAFGT
ncbi:GSCFA domain-containing protein [Asticcacaulis solisilvae]|uniref:GSCFA domain-containing protein n=1 Tax=Asticcacaulis solisilvae TaxID=1217274 RepID=UPI003FD81ED8